MEHSEGEEQNTIDMEENTTQTIKNDHVPSAGVKSPSKYIKDYINTEQLYSRVDSSAERKSPKLKATAGVDKI